MSQRRPNQPQYLHSGFGQRLQYVQLYDGDNAPQLVPVTVQYVIRLPFQPKVTSSNAEVRPYQTDTDDSDADSQKSAAAAIRFPGPAGIGQDPPVSGYPSSISLVDLVQSPGHDLVPSSGFTHQGTSGNTFQMKPALGAVPVVPPGAYEPFSMFWYLPVNPQIPIDYFKIQQATLVQGQHHHHHPLAVGGSSKRLWHLSVTSPKYYITRTVKPKHYPVIHQKLSQTIKNYNKRIL